MKLNYLTEAELELTAEEVDHKIVCAIIGYLGFPPHSHFPQKLHGFLDDVRAHENYLFREKWRAIQLKKLDELQQSFKDMDLLYSELKNIPWYHSGEEVVQRLK